MIAAPRPSSLWPFCCSGASGFSVPRQAADGARRSPVYNETARKTLSLVRSWLADGDAHVTCGSVRDRCAELNIRSGFCLDRNRSTSVMLLQFRDYFLDSVI
jgi:hypothetical protein